MMIAKSNSHKAMLLFVLALLSVSLVTAFPQSALGGAQHHPGNTFTVAGQSRQCSQYPDETGTFTGAKTIQSNQLPALVDIYYVNTNGGWTYYNEFEAPVAFSGANRQYAYEVYYCPVVTSTCTNGQKRAVTETSYQTCNGGVWSTITNCAAGEFYSPQDGQCKTYACHEQWSCTVFGQCTQSGIQYRTCTDANRCGTFADQPATATSCTPVIPNNPSQGLKIIDQPTLNSYAIAAPGTAVVVGQWFNVTTPGSYWIEAGLEQVRPFSIVATVEKNTCNPEETWYANQLVNFPTAGKQFANFVVTPQANGEYAFHTAIVAGCAGEVIQQSNSVQHLVVGDQNAGKVLALGTSTILIIAGVIVLIAGVIILLIKKK